MVRALLQELQRLLAAVQYFTRLAIPRWTRNSPDELSGISRYLPLVGILVGLVAGSAFLLALRVFPETVAVLLSMLAGVLVTGGLHEDGLADVCDGFAGGWDKAQILSIMKDPRIGAQGALGLLLAVALKFAALSAVPAMSFLGVSVAAHSISRFMAVSVMRTQRYVREDDRARARPVAHPLKWSDTGTAALFGLAPIAFIGWAAIAGAVGALGARLLAAQYFYRRIGGYTGDCLGAIQQATEIAFYLGWLACSRT